MKSVAPLPRPPAAAPRSAPQEVRIIGGQWRRSVLPVASRPGLRPTPNRVRETLFNWLGQDLSGWRVVDAYAGSGALGFEAASRGAASVLLLEQDPLLVRSLESTRLKLKAAGTVRVQRADALGWLKAAPDASLDLVLLDPPFDSALAPASLAASVRLVVPGGYIYIETPQAWVDALPSGLTVYRQSRAGAVHFALLQAPPAAPAAA